MGCVHVPRSVCIFGSSTIRLFFVRPTGRLPHMRRQAMDRIGEESTNRHGIGPSLGCVQTVDRYVVCKQPQMYNMDMVAERTRILTDVAEALSRCSCTRSPSCPSYRSFSELHIWAAAKWNCFTRRLLGVNPPTRRSGMRLRGKGKLITC